MDKSMDHLTRNPPRIHPRYAVNPLATAMRRFRSRERDSASSQSSGSSNAKPRRDSPPPKRHSAGARSLALRTSGNDQYLPDVRFSRQPTGDSVLLEGASSGESDEDVFPPSVGGDKDEVGQYEEVGQETDATRDDADVKVEETEVAEDEIANAAFESEPEAHGISETVEVAGSSVKDAFSHFDADISDAETEPSPESEAHGISETVEVAGSSVKDAFSHFDADISDAETESSPESEMYYSKCRYTVKEIGSGPDHDKRFDEDKGNIFYSDENESNYEDMPPLIDANLLETTAAAAAAALRKASAATFPAVIVERNSDHSEDILGATGGAPLEPHWNRWDIEDNMTEEQRESLAGLETSPVGGEVYMSSDSERVSENDQHQILPVLGVKGAEELKGTEGYQALKGIPLPPSGSTTQPARVRPDLERSLRINVDFNENEMIDSSRVFSPSLLKIATSQPFGYGLMDMDKEMSGLIELQNQVFAESMASAEPPLPQPPLPAYQLFPEKRVTLDKKSEAGIFSLPQPQQLQPRALGFPPGDSFPQIPPLDLSILNVPPPNVPRSHIPQFTCPPPDHSILKFRPPNHFPRHVPIPTSQSFPGIHILGNPNIGNIQAPSVPRVTPPLAPQIQQPQPLAPPPRDRKARNKVVPIVPFRPFRLLPGLRTKRNGSGEYNPDDDNNNEQGEVNFNYGDQAESLSLMGPLLLLHEETAGILKEFWPWPEGRSFEYSITEGNFISVAEKDKRLFHLDNSIYASDVFRYLKRRVSDYRVPDYMRWQTSMNNWKRAVSIEWIFMAQDHFEVSNKTAHLAVKTLDRFMSKTTNRVRDFDLLAPACFFIASKYEENYVLEQDVFLQVSEYKFDLKDLLEAEKEVLKTIDFDLGSASIIDFVEFYKLWGSSAEKDVSVLVNYLADFFVLDYEATIAIDESRLAAACYTLAFLLKGYPVESLWKITGFPVQKLNPIISRLTELLEPDSPLLDLETVFTRFERRDQKFIYSSLVDGMQMMRDFRTRVQKV